MASQIETVMVSAAPARVVVLEDRAQVERRGSATVPGGVTRLRIDGVAPAAVERSLKAEVTGGKVLEARLHRRWRERPAGGVHADASELRKTLRALELEVQRLSDEQSRLFGRRDLLLATRADLLREMSQAAGFGRVDPPTWSAQLASLTKEEAANDTAIREVATSARLIQAQYHQANQALSVGEREEQIFECAIELLVESSGGALPVKVSYLVPGAVWRPAYRATLVEKTVTVECEAVVWQHTDEVWSNVELAFSTARPTLGTRPPDLSEDRIRTRPKQQIEKKVVSVAVREEVIQSAGEGGTTPTSEMPGLDDGGEAQLLQAPARASIPSDGQPHRVKLSTYEAPAAVERVCSPELTPLVSLVARFANAGSHVMLAGPVDLVRKSGFIGRGQVKFAGLGETVKLSFGSEDGMRVVRRVDEKTDEARLTGRRTTKKKVTLYVSNATPEPTKLVLEERVPVSEVKEVEIQLIAKESKPAPSGVSEEGIARIPLELAANATTEVLFVWELSAAARVAGI